MPGFPRVAVWLPHVAVCCPTGSWLQHASASPILELAKRSGMQLVLLHRPPASRSPPHPLCLPPPCQAQVWLRLLRPPRGVAAGGTCDRAEAGRGPSPQPDLDSPGRRQQGGAGSHPRGSQGWDAPVHVHRCGGKGKDGHGCIMISCSTAARQPIVGRQLLCRAPACFVRSCFMLCQRIAALLAGRQG